VGSVAACAWCVLIFFPAGRVARAAIRAPLSVIGLAGVVHSHVLGVPQFSARAWPAGGQHHTVQRPGRRAAPPLPPARSGWPRAGERAGRRLARHRPASQGPWPNRKATPKKNRFRGCRQSQSRPVKHLRLGRAQSKPGHLPASHRHRGQASSSAESRRIRDPPYHHHPDTLPTATATPGRATTTPRGSASARGYVLGIR